MRWFHPAAPLFILLALWGCGSKPKTGPEPETVVSLWIEAGFHSNATASEQAAPLQSRLYELTDKTLFDQADFLDIFLNDSTRLQDTLVKKHTLPTIQPGTQTSLSLQLDSSTRYIAFFAEFARYDTALPKDTQAVSTGKNNLFTVYIDENRLRLSRQQEPDTNGE